MFERTLLKTIQADEALLDDYEGVTFTVEQARKLTEILEKDQKAVDIYKLMRGD